ncbi:MAG: peptide chain release factor 1 [Candidatus Nealsonbacteria bacterium DGGOD1a]|jgi:Protein chain release factor A|nr:MAG: peptide chain release factor 1 [Candidatus Nealsonbacteria bacterium DGGOD1a]
MTQALSPRQEYDKILNQLSDPELISDWEKFETLNKRKSFLEKLIEKESEIREIGNKIEENRLIILSEEDPELTSLAEVENEQLKARQTILEKESQELIKSENKPAGPDAIVVEIRGGTGGEEAALFAADIYRMYARFAQTKGWNQKILDSNQTEIGGYKEIIFELKGKGVWEAMKYEGGVHRIQRIPETEKNGRIHTSTATVAVLPKPKKSEISIRPDEIRIEFCRSSGPGGQFVNKRESAVRITHIPTGLAVFSQTERNQLQNRENAMALLEYRLQEKRTADENAAFGGARKEQIGGGERSEKIRTYNIPQDRVTDHRIKKSWHDIEGIFNGNIEDISKSLQEELDKPE